MRRTPAYILIALIAAFGPVPAFGQNICGGATATVTAVGTSATAVPATPLTGRSQVTVCNSDENTGTPLLKCRADGNNPTIGATNPGDLIRKGACWTYYAPSGKPIKCIADTADTQVTTTECITLTPLPHTPPALVTVDSDGNIGVGSTPVNTAGQTGECLIVATAGGTACPATPLTGRRSAKLTNNGPNTIWCALGSSVPEVGKGDPIYPLGWAVYEGSMAITCIAETADQVTTAATTVSEIAP